MGKQQNPLGLIRKQFKEKNKTKQNKKRIHVDTVSNSYTKGMVCLIRKIK